MSLSRYVDAILRSGLPGVREPPDGERGLQLDSYIGRIVQRELPDLGVSVRRPSALRAWLAAYAAATASDATYARILDAATGGEPDKPTRQTVAGYREHLSRVFVLDPVPAWLPTFAPLKRRTAHRSSIWPTRPWRRGWSVSAKRSFRAARGTRSPRLPEPGSAPSSSRSPR